MISLRNIEKAFAHGPAKTYVLRRIDLDIKPGEFVSIMGPSGAGKSTLLHILGMHDQSWTGEYYFDDVAVHKLDGKKRAALRNQNIGFVFQSYHLLDDQTVFENLELPLSYRDVSRKDRQSIVCDTLDRSLANTWASSAPAVPRMAISPNATAHTRITSSSDMPTSRSGRLWQFESHPVICRLYVAETHIGHGPDTARSAGPSRPGPRSRRATSSCPAGRRSRNDT